MDVATDGGFEYSGFWSSKCGFWVSILILLDFRFGRV